MYKGKVILTGEHSVVHGYPAILASLDLGISASIKPGVLNDQQKNDQYLQHILQIFAELASIKEFKISLKANSDLPIKSGLGSSAAFAAAVFRELASFYNYSLDSDQLYNLVLEAENFVHGKSSGADPSIVVYGGLLAFKKGKIKQIPPSVLTNQTFFLISSGEAKESTGEMVAKVASEVKNQAILQQIGDLSQKMISDLENNRFNHILLNENELLLEEIGVVGILAKKMIKKLQKIGAFCKITGAGGIKAGSGYILAFHEDAQKFEGNLQAMGFTFFKTQLGAK